MDRDFDFLGYINSIEKMMVAWYEHCHETFKHSDNLGSAREHFVREILVNFLPKTVVVGTGEITDGKKRSGQQDIVIYRSDFPVLSGFGLPQTFLIDGVIATIEVKSNLSTGSPNHLFKACKNIETVLSLTNQGVILTDDSEKPSDEETHKLMEAHSVKTYVIGYQGWKTKESLLQNYLPALNAVQGKVPDIVYQPGQCVIKNRPSASIRYLDNDQNANPSEFPLVHLSQYPFAVFFQHLLRTIMAATGGIMATLPDTNARILYDFNNYFSLPKLPCTPLQFVFDPAQGTEGLNE